MLLLRVPRDVPLFLLLPPSLLAHASEENYMTARFVCVQFGKLGLGVEGGRRTLSLNLEKESCSKLLAS